MSAPPTPTRPQEPEPIFSASHIVYRSGVGPKALRPLRGRVPREPWPRRHFGMLARMRRSPNPRSPTLLTHQLLSGMTPVMFELGARPHPPRELYRAYLEQS